MALDKQKILNELGSVVNQLQSANCGCLGNLFENAAAVPQHLTHGHTHPTSGGHHHCSPGSHGDPYAVHNQAYNQCNHHCHPAKVYGDTQNYLNNNIVQPIVNEVYEELKSITPENTIVNTALVNQMGLHQTGVPQGNQLKLGQNNLPNQSNFGNIPQNNMHKPSYGQHAQGMAKFKEMFPGVTGQGDLGFDPMEIALQMNPANRQNSANNAAQKLINKVSTMNKPPNNYELPMNNFKQANISQTLNPTNMIHETNTYANSVPVAESNIKSFPMNPVQNQQPSHEQNFNNKGVVYQTDLQACPAMSGQHILQSQVPNDQTNQSNANNSLPSHYPTTAEMSIMNPITEHEPATQMAPENGNYQQASNQPIFPIEATNYQYNTLGQPVEMLPANAYRLPKLTLPQTLSPEPIPLNYSNSARYSNVKSTVSKTSLMGIRSEGGTPSKSKLQRMYKEYKGYQSFVPQHPNVAYGMTHSDGKLNVHNCKENNNFRIERTGGDTMLNNDMIQKLEADGHIGDASANDKPNESITEKSSPNIQRKGRNGLQDMVFTSYPSSTAWSFHGR